MRTLTGPLRTLGHVAFSPDGAELVAVGTHDYAFGGVAQADRGVLVWRLAGDPAAPRHLFPDRTAGGAAYSADGRWLYVTLLRRLPDTGVPLGLFAVDRRTAAEPPQPLYRHHRIAAGGKRLLSAGVTGDYPNVGHELRLSSPAGRSAWAVPYPAGAQPLEIALLSAGRAAVVEHSHNPRGPDHLSLTVHRAADGSELARVPIPGRMPGPLTASPDGKHLVMAAGGNLLVWDATDWDAAPRKVVFGKRHCTGVAFPPAGGFALASGNDGGVRRLRADDWAAAHTYAWQAGKARSVAVAPDGLTAAVGTDRGTVVLFDLD